MKQKRITLRVTFTGILGVFSHSDPEDPRVLIVSPNGIKNADDGPVAAPHAWPDDRRRVQENLGRHYCFVRIPSVHLPSAQVEGSPPLESLWYLAERDLRFGVDPGPRSEIPEEVIRFDDVSDFTGFSREIVSDPGSAGVLARIHLPGGRLSAGDTILWSFDDTLKRGGAPKEREYTSALHYEAQATGRHVELTTTGFDGSPAATLRLVPDEAGDVHITVANLCSENPLDWPLDPEPRDDHDYRWYYMLLDDESFAASIRAAGKGELPIPRPVVSEMGPLLGAGVDCLPVYLGDLDW